MQRILFGLLITALLLVACAGPATPTPEMPAVEPTAVPPTVAAQPTETQSMPTQSEPATMPPASDTPPPVQPAAEVRTFQIVPGESTVQYEVGETFINQNNRFNLAVGVTPQVTGEVQVDAANPGNSTLGPISIDISQFKSDSDRRDNKIRQDFLESSRFPIATFTPTQVEALPASYTPGQELAFKVTGDLTVKETTRPVTFDVTAKLDGDTLSGTATTTLLMSDFAVGPITIGGILNTEDQVKLIFTFVARP